MNRLEQLKAIIDTALQAPGKSKLTDEVINSVGGFTSPNIRHLMNNLGAISKNYLEIGSHCGATLISTVYGNDNLESATGVDNFSLFDQGHNARGDFYKHCDKFIPGKYGLIEKDCWTILPHEALGIDLYLYDGDHSYESQKKGITHFAPFWADECIVVVDDFQWPEPCKGTWDGLREIGANVEWFCTLDSGRRSDCGDRGWWNGLYVAYIKK